MNNKSHLTVALVGNPNCGKTTLFNALTGSRQRIGNWPGVTVERKSGLFTHQQQTVEVIDLPGTYSLNVMHASSALDEQIACEVILKREADVVVNILDASNLERHLYLTLQLLDMQVPLIVAVNMMDVARHQGLRILVDVLQQALGCTVVPIEADKKRGVQALKEHIIHHAADAIPPVPTLDLPPVLRDAIADISPKRWLAVCLLEEDASAQQLADTVTLEKTHAWQKKVNALLNEDADILLADARYRWIQTVLQRCLQRATAAKTSWTTRIDNIVLNRLLGVPIFLLVMYGMFFFAINIGGAFQDFFDLGSRTVFVEGVAYGLTQLHCPIGLIALLANGIGQGINTTITFIPVIGALFLFLALLEDSGYMARAAFVVDRLMRALGLPGKSFVPMIIGFGCNVPAVMAARTLENKRDRILTVMMSPFMSCGARLAIYAVFTAAFFPVGGQNVVFILYLTGIVMAMLTGLLLRKTVLKGDPAPLAMELPPYHLPHFKTLGLHAWQRLQGFVLRAGKLIIPICILIGAFSAININGTLNADGDVNSLLSMLGRLITPIFAPMGIHQDNWPATVGLLTGVLAKEVVVGTLNALYSQLGHLAVLQPDTFSLGAGLHAALASIPVNLADLSHSLGNPILAQAPVHALTQGVYGLMYQRFDGQIGAIAYLLFVLLYFPCVSTTAAMWREVGRGWTLFSMLWTTGIAYSVAVGFYQLATLASHPLSSSLWAIGVMALLLITILSVRAYASPLSMEAV